MLPWLSAAEHTYLLPDAKTLLSFVQFVDTRVDLEDFLALLSHCYNIYLRTYGFEQGLQGFSRSGGGSFTKERKLKFNMSTRINYFTQKGWCLICL